MVVPDIDWGSLADEEIGIIYNAAIAERDRRMIPERIDTLQRQKLELAGAEDGEPWEQPTGSEDAYPKGWVVQHGGKKWESITPFNTWEPGQDPNNRLWREVVPLAPTEPETPTAPAAWVPNAVVSVGQMVTYNNVMYRVVQAHTTQVGWEPPNVPALWQRSLPTNTPGSASASRT